MEQRAVKWSEMKHRALSHGFTIVELLIVIVVIAILAAITIVSYNGISARAKEATLRSDLSNGVTQLSVEKIKNEVYPDDIATIKKSDTTAFQYDHTSTTYCLTATSSVLPGVAFHVSDTSGVESGACPGHDINGPPPAVADGVRIQTISKDRCPDNRVRAVDARDMHTYWIQRMSDNNCWMLTNLAYRGGTDNGGTNEYGDERPSFTLITTSTTNASLPYIYEPPNSNITTEPTNPSTSTDGGQTDPQNGYFYNWCAAKGAVPTFCGSWPSDVAISACPGGWRLPTIQEYQGLPAANSPSSHWLPQGAGKISMWGTLSFAGQGWYWSQYDSAHGYAPAFLRNGYSSTSPSEGYSIRCVAQ